MRYAVLNLSFVAIILVLSAGCSKNNGRDVEQQTSRETDRIEAASSTQHCFRNEYPFDDEPDQRDIEELVVVIDGSHATGDYNWIPVYKDSRLGRFDGTIQNDSISASYEFEQEGQSETAIISITLEKGQAIIKGESPEPGLDSTLARVDC